MCAFIVRLRHAQLKIRPLRKESYIIRVLSPASSFLQSPERSGSEAQRERQEPHSVLAVLVEWSGVDMDVCI